MNDPKFNKAVIDNLLEAGTIEDVIVLLDGVRKFIDLSVKANTDGMEQTIASLKRARVDISFALKTIEKTLLFKEPK